MLIDFETAKIPISTGIENEKNREY